MDSVMLLEPEVQKAIINKEAVVALFLDIEKAYDILWREGLVIKLYKIGIRERMLNWIKDFLQSRKIQLRVGGEFSEVLEIDIGTPQDSVISPVLFNVMINDIFSNFEGGDLACLCLLMMGQYGKGDELLIL